MVEVFEVIHPGIYSSFQDLGRTGWRKYGVPLSGAVDRISMQAANLLVGNALNDVAIETLLQGLKLRVLNDCYIAITGGDLGFCRNQTYCAPWGSYLLKKGDIIQFKKRHSGLRVYLGIKGGFKAQEYMDSASVFELGRLGNKISAGDILNSRTDSILVGTENLLPRKILPSFGNHTIMRIILGPQSNAFKKDGIQTFLHSIYQISPESSRMAYRLNGPSIAHKERADIISEPVVPGSIQVPAGGQPIILLADAQVTGGYAKIATAIEHDLSMLAQCIPGGTVKFKEIVLKEAKEVRSKANNFFNLIRNTARKIS